MHDIYIRATSAEEVLAVLPAWLKDAAGEVLPVSVRHVVDWDILNEQGWFLANLRVVEEADAVEVLAALGTMVIVPQFPKRVFA